MKITQKHVQQQQHTNGTLSLSDCGLELALHNHGNVGDEDKVDGVDKADDDFGDDFGDGFVDDFHGNLGDDL